jgi:VanZ family protein
MKMTVAPTPHVRRAGLVITIASLAAIAFATLLPEPAAAASSSHFCLVCGSLGGVNAILNVFLFVPLGIGLALFGIQGKRALLAVCALSALIETAQLLVIPGRDATIGDVLTNTLGGALGFAIGRYAELWLRPPPRIARNLAVGWGTIWLAIQIISNFGLALSLPDSQYYGQIARVLVNFAVFPGLVLTASIDDVQIPNTAFSDGRRVQRLLLDGATVAATVVPAEPTPDIAPIVRVADAKEKEIVLLAQNGERLVFGVHNGAAVLRLRTLLFALPDAFPTRVSSLALAADTLRISGRYVARVVRMSAQSRSATHDRRIPLSASLGWAFWLPFPWFIEGTRAELVVSWIWFACLVIPLGYWSLRIVDASRSQEILRHWAPVLLAGTALLCAGLVLVPHTFGLSAAPLRDWLATLAGALVGCGLGALMTKLTGTGSLATAHPGGG